MEHLVRAIKEGGADRAATREMRSFVEKVGEKVLQEKEKIRKTRPRKKPGVRKPLEPGMEVLVGAHRRRGVLERRLKDGRWLLSTGAVRVTVPEEDLLPADPGRAEKNVIVSLGDTAPAEPAKFELDLRGMRAEEALGALRKQMDLAVMQGLQEFGIIHGKGEGILQGAVRDYLKTCTAVQEFSFARPEAGGTGKTLVKLKN